MREVQVAAVDLHLFDQLVRCGRCCNEAETRQMRTALVEHLKELHLPAMRTASKKPPVGLRKRH